MKNDAQHRNPASKQDGPAMPLSMASVGQEVVLAKVQGGREFQHRMAEMGLVPGTPFTVLSKGHPGPFIVSVKNSRMVLGRGMVHRVLVNPK